MRKSLLNATTPFKHKGSHIPYATEEAYHAEKGGEVNVDEDDPKKKWYEIDDSIFKTTKPPKTKDVKEDVEVDQSEKDVIEDSPKDLQKEKVEAAIKKWEEDPKNKLKKN